MITVGIKTNRKTLHVDFHQSGFSFSDFYELWDYCLVKAYEKRIFRIRLIHGRGRDENGLAYIDEGVRSRLKGLRGVRSFNPEVGNYGVTLVHLSPRNPRLKDRPSHFRALAALSHKLKTEDIISEVELKESQEDRLHIIVQMLDTEWNEVVIIDLLQEWLKMGRRDLVRSILDEIEPFEIFYSTSFKKKLTRIIGDLEEL